MRIDIRTGHGGHGHKISTTPPAIHSQPPLPQPRRQRDGAPARSPRRCDPAAKNAGFGVFRCSLSFLSCFVCGSLQTAIWVRKAPKVPRQPPGGQGVAPGHPWPTGPAENRFSNGLQCKMCSQTSGHTRKSDQIGCKSRGGAAKPAWLQPRSRANCSKAPRPPRHGSATKIPALLAQIGVLNVCCACE